MSYYLGNGDEYADVTVWIFPSESKASDFFESEMQQSKALGCSCSLVEKNKQNIDFYELVCAVGMQSWQQAYIWKGKNLVLSVSEPKSEGGVIFEAYLDKYY